MEIEQINELIESKKNAWSKLYDAKKWRADHDDVEIKAHQAYFTITRTDNSQWIPQDIQDKIEEVKEYFKKYWNEHREHISEYQKEYYLEHREKRSPDQDH